MQFAFTPLQSHLLACSSPAQLHADTLLLSTRLLPCGKLMFMNIHRHTLGFFFLLGVDLCDDLEPLWGSVGGGNVLERGLNPCGNRGRAESVSVSCPTKSTSKSPGRLVRGGDGSGIRQSWTHRLREKGRRASPGLEERTINNRE